MFACRFEVGSDSLTIHDVREDDEGNYTCIRNTTLDQDSASAMLTVVGTLRLYITLNTLTCFRQSFSQKLYIIQYGFLDCYMGAVVELNLYFLYN